MAYGATSQLSSEKQLLAALAGGAIALAAHGGKTAARVAVTPSPEPVSNIALSTGEDVFVIFLTWFAARHPVIAGLIVAGLLWMLLLAARWIVRALKGLFRGAGAALAANS